MNATRQGDCCTGHDSCPPVPLVEFSPDVNINGRVVPTLDTRMVFPPGAPRYLSMVAPPAGRGTAYPSAAPSGTEAAMFLSGGEAGV